MEEGFGRAAALHLPCQRPGRDRRLAEHVAPPPVGHRDQRIGGAPVVGETGLPEHHRGADPLGHPALERGPCRGCLQVARRAAPPHGLRAEDRAGGLFDAVPPGATAEVGEEGAVDLIVGHRPGECGQSHHDPRRAESALAAAGPDQRIGPRRPRLGGQALEGRHAPTVQPADRGHAGDPGGAVHPDRAAAALALWTAAVLDRPQPELLA